jgi:cytochrome c-type biogenesis protein CcmH
MPKKSYCYGFLWALLILLAGLMFSPVRTVWAQETTPSDDDVNRIASQLYCPVCENIPLDACPTQACEQWRDLIRQKLAEGWSDEEIKAYFVAQYGDRVLAEPPRRGLNWLIYILPGVALLLGLVLLVRFFRKTSAPPSKGEEAAVEMTTEARIDDPYMAQVERDLAEMD